MSRWARVMAAFLFGTCFPQAVFAAEVLKSGDLDQLTDAVIEAAFAQERQPSFDFVLEDGDVGTRLNIVALFSERNEVSLFADRCAANSILRRIGCDLRFLNPIVSGTLALSDPIEPETAKDRGKSQFRNGPYRTMLKWVLAHEVGHIVLGHAEGEYSDTIHGQSVFNNLRQKRELEADQFSISLIGKLDQESATTDYAFVLHSANMLIRRNLCPETFPETCDRIAPGVGLLFNHADGKPIRISAGGSHPDFVARFVRLIYLSGVGTDENSINYLAMNVIEKFLIETPDGELETVANSIPADTRE